MRVRRRHIRNLVKQLLLSNDIKSAPVDIEKIAENFRIQIEKQNAEDEVAGFLLKDFDSKNALIGVNTHHNPNRQRFTIAHELGHYFLHDYEGVHFDSKTTGLRMYLRNEKSTTGTDLEEREANLFAAELLMPEDLLKEDLADIKEIYLIDENDETIKNLAKRYGVSVRALTYRLSNLGYIEL
jgi:Zn-dependent peptidase ImmA (M78 family)